MKLSQFITELNGRMESLDPESELYLQHHGEDGELKCSHITDVDIVGGALVFTTEDLSEDGE